MGDAVGISLALAVLAGGFVIGRSIEKRHYRSIRLREEFFMAQPAVTFATLPDDRPVERIELARGSVVLTYDVFKTFMSGFRAVVGGEMRSLSPVLDRARREAILRMKQSCPEADLYLNCRLATSTLSGPETRSNLGAVEVMAYATAIHYTKGRPEGATVKFVARELGDASEASSGAASRGRKAREPI
jgi:uncharacterized protein YbjQ (UPF0145 family)